MSNGDKVNTVTLDDVPVLFVSSNTAFDVKFLVYHDMLRFRGFLSTRAVSFAGQHVLFPDSQHCDRNFRGLYQDARFLMLSMQEFKHLGGQHLLSIKIGDELSPDALQEYDIYMHERVFPPANVASVKELAGDGNEKVLIKICGGKPLPMKRAGAPTKQRTAPKPYNNGWFMLTSPADGRVIAVHQQFEPENYEVVIKSLSKVLHVYTHCNAFIYDRCCKLQPEMERRKLFPQVKYWSVDKFHASGHCAACKNSPLTVRRLKDRMRHVNTSVAEQAFSWFRGYARTFNELGSARHVFLVLYYAKMHDDAIDCGNPAHLNQFSTSKKNARYIRGYACNTKAKQALKAVKAMKAMKVMKAVKVMSTMKVIKSMKAQPGKLAAKRK